MFESLTAGAERALKRAEAVARRREAELVEPLDLLAALTLETESRAAELMAEFGVEAARIWIALGLEAMEIVPSDEPFSFDSAPVAARGGPLPQSPALRLVLSEAMSQVRGIDRNREAGTEHLLAGLISASDVAADLLRSAGLDFQPLQVRLTETVLDDTAPLPLAEGIPPLELTEAGGGADLARILDASANRAREGLRVVEDYVRFALDDPGLTRRLKEIRHRLAEAERGLDACLLIDARETPPQVRAWLLVV